MLPVKSLSPIIISASRATDIPGLYGDWFIERLKKGFFTKQNSFSNSRYIVNTDKTELIVFWTKNPKPFFNKLPYLDKYFPNYYFQFTLNNYTSEFEPGLSGINERIETFIHLSEKIGKEKVIWRFDPVFLTNHLKIDDLTEIIEKIAEKIYNYTSKLVFSFIDIYNYRKVKNKINKSKLEIRELNELEMKEFALNIKYLQHKYNLEISSCAEKIDLSEFNIQKNKCIDNKLIVKLFQENLNLMNYLKIKSNHKDVGQRKECLCVRSIDVGQYNSCLYQCIYCYANISKQSSTDNFIKHQMNPFNSIIY